MAQLAKVSDWGTVAKMAAHHARTRPTLSADPALLARNEWLIRAEGGLVDAVKTRIDRAELLRKEAAEAEGRTPPKKRRKDAVLAVEVVLSASPEFFRPERPWEAGACDPERLAAWRDASLAWLKGRYGENLVSAVLHLDEATPHIQAVFVPLTAHHRLSASELVGGREELRRFQDGIGQALAPLGIQRGMESSVAVHRSVAEYYGLVNKAWDDVEPPEVTLETPPLLGREAWAARQVERINEQVGGGRCAKPRRRPTLRSWSARRRASCRPSWPVRRPPPPSWCARSRPRPKPALRRPSGRPRRRVGRPGKPTRRGPRPSATRTWPWNAPRAPLRPSRPYSVVDHHDPALGDLARREHCVDQLPRERFAFDEVSRRPRGRV